MARHTVTVFKGFYAANLTCTCGWRRGIARMPGLEREIADAKARHLARGGEHG